MLKRLALAFATALVFSTGLAGAPTGASAGVQIDIDFFHDRLLPYGNWRYHPSYGQVWSPRGVGRDWRPYTEGRWAWTNDYGWMWVEDEPWGWATYHYGRWFLDARHGWLWLPGNQWAPAWVRWRHGGGNVGWAPLAPFGIDSYPGYWIFVSENRFLHRRLRPVVFYPTRDRNYFDDCRVIGGVSRHRDRWVNHDVDWRRIERVSKHKIVPVHVRDFDDVGPPRFDGNRSEVRVYRPSVRGTPEQWRERSQERERAAIGRREGEESARKIPPRQQERRDAAQQRELEAQQEPQHRQGSERKALQEREQRRQESERAAQEQQKQRREAAQQRATEPQQMRRQREDSERRAQQQREERRQQTERQAQQQEQRREALQQRAAEQQQVRRQREESERRAPQQQEQRRQEAQSRRTEQSSAEPRQPQRQESDNSRTRAKRAREAEDETGQPQARPAFGR